MFTPSRTVINMTYLKERNILLYSTINTGNIEYISGNMVQSPPITIIHPILSGTTNLSISLHEKYLAVGDATDKLRIYSLASNNMLHTKATAGLRVKVMTWNSDETILYYLNEGKDYLYFINVSNNFASGSSKTVYRTPN